MSGAEGPEGEEGACLPSSQPELTLLAKGFQSQQDPLCVVRPLEGLRCPQLDRTGWLRKPAVRSTCMVVFTRGTSGRRGLPSSG